MVDLLLVIAVDVSGSIDEAEARLQRQGYIMALTDRQVQAAIAGGPAGAIAVAYVEWAAFNRQKLLIPWTRIGSAGDSAAWADRLANSPHESIHRTSLSGALLFCEKVLAEAPFSASRRVIDVSGDGVNNDGPEPENARDRLVAAGAVINGLPIINKRVGWGIGPALAPYYRDAVIGGAGSFLVVAESFGSFGEAIRRKLVQEIAWFRMSPRAARALAASSEPLQDCIEELERVTEAIGSGMADGVSDAIVIGAGVLGASTAFRLAEAGLRVTILEAERVGAGTSGTSFAWINSNGKPPRPYHDLNVAGMRAHFALRDEFPATPWLHEGGSLEIVPAAEAAALEAKVAQLREWGYAAELITPAQLRELEPEVTLDALGADAAIAWFPEEGWIDPVLFAHAMVRRAQSLGARLHVGIRVAEMVMDAYRAVGVRTTDGRRFDAGLVVNCAGRWSNAASLDARLQIPLAPRVGVLVFTRPAPTMLARVLRTPLVDMRPDGAGRLMLHDNAIDAEFDVDSPVGPTMPQAVRITENVAKLLPQLAGLQPEAVRITARPIPADGYSAIGTVPGITGYYLAVTHSGVTMSAHLGKLIAQEAVGEEACELAPFRPARFFTGNLQPGSEATAFDRAN